MVGHIILPYNSGVGGGSFIAPTLIDTLPLISDGMSTPNSSVSWTGKNLGDAHANNWVLAVLNLNFLTGGTPTITIGGVTATLVRQREHSVWSNDRVAIYKANVPAGATGTITLAWTAYSLGAVTGALYKMRTTNSVPSDSGDADGGGSFADASVALTVPSGGGAIWVGGGEDAVGTPLTGTDIVDDYSPPTNYACAAGSTTVAGSKTATRSGAGSARANLVGAAWGP